MNGQERPTALGVRIDVSAANRRASAAPASSEAALFQGYGAPLLVTSLCACGGVIRADPNCPGLEVREHNETPLHLAWRKRSL